MTRGGNIPTSDIDVEKTRRELKNAHPGCRLVVAEDKQEMIAEISDGFAVAVIERSPPHFHIKMREVYRVLRGTLFVACGGYGNVLRQGETIAIEPGQIHFARASRDPAWIEVKSSPLWSADDHFVLIGTAADDDHDAKTRTVEAGGRETDQIMTQRDRVYG